MLIRSELKTQNRELAAKQSSENEVVNITDKRTLANQIINEESISGSVAGSYVPLSKRKATNKDNAEFINEN